MTGPSDSGLVSFITSLDKTRQSHPAVEHALTVRSSLLTTNYRQFFAMWATAPNMSGYLMDPLADSMRVRSARILVSAYRPKLALADLTKMLAFDREEDDTDMDTDQPSESAQRKCQEYMDNKFPGLFVWLKDPPANGIGLGAIHVDCKSTFERMQPTNNEHRLPINSGRSRHTVSSSSPTIQANTSSPKMAPIGGVHEVGMWIKKDAIGVTPSGKIALGRIEGSAMKPLALPPRSAGQPTRNFANSSPSPSPSMSPTPSPSSSPSLTLDDPVAIKRRNSQPLSMMSAKDLKAKIDELEAILLNPTVKQEYDDFNLQLMISQLKAYKQAHKKAKK